MPKRKVFTLFISLLLLSSFLQGLNAREVSAATGYIAITKTQTLDITYDVMQIQSNIPITQVRVGNDVINEVEGWGAWTDLTDADGYVIPGGLLVGTATVKNWSLPAGNVNNETKVCIQVRDSLGNMTAWNANCGYVYWDTAAPSTTKYLLNNGSTWDNDWKLPVFIQFIDAAGMNSVTAVSISENGGAYVNLPGTVCTLNQTTNRFDCTINTTFNADSSRGSSTYQIRYCDNLGNCATSALTTITFAENAPNGTVSIAQNASAPNLVDVTWTAVDVAGLGGTSGISHITIENVTTNPANINKEIIYSSTSYPASVGGTKLCYTLRERTGIVKMTIYNRAGSSTVLYSNAVTANLVGFDSTVISKVINPNKYNLSSPFIPLTIGPETTLDEYPEAVTGGNIAITQTFFWDNNVTAVEGFYQFLVHSTNGYSQFVTREFSLSDLTVNGNIAVLEMQTIVDKLAPISTEADITYIALQVEMYVTITGQPNKIPLYFPAKGDTYNIAIITGSIDDSINYESGN